VGVCINIQRHIQAKMWYWLGTRYKVGLVVPCQSENWCTLQKPASYSWPGELRVMQKAGGAVYLYIEPVPAVTNDEECVWWCCAPPVRCYSYCVGMWSTNVQILAGPVGLEWH